jgi:hypothetical protein
MAEEDKSFSGKLKIWFSVAGAGVGLAISVFTLKEKMDSPGEKPKTESAPAPQVTRVEVVQTGGPNAAASAAPAQAPAAAPKPPRVREQKVDVPPFPATRTTEYLVARATGNGPSFASAASSAIAQALSMRLGAQVSSDVLLALKGETVSTDTSDSSNYRESLGARYSAASKGLVKWWDWEKEEVTDGRYEISVVAVLARRKPKVPDPSGRKIVAVLPFSLDQDFSAMAAKVSKVQFGRSIAEAAANHLTQGRKFQIVTADLGALAAQAAKMGSTGLQATVEAAEELDADYVVMGEGEKLEVSRFRPGQGVLPAPVASGAIGFKVLKVESGQTVLSKRFDLKNLKPEVLGGSKVESSVADALGIFISNQLHETVFPIKVLALNGDSEVVLNRGGDALAVGDVYEIFTLGPVVKDPDTGESLQLESKSGEITIFRVTPKMSYGTISNRTGTVVPESICRKK